MDLEQTSFLAKPYLNHFIVIYFYSVAETLLNHGADVHAQNDAGKTA